MIASRIPKITKQWDIRGHECPPFKKLPWSRDVPLLLHPVKRR